MRFPGDIYIQRWVPTDGFKLVRAAPVNPGTMEPGGPLEPCIIPVDADHDDDRQEIFLLEEEAALFVEFTDLEARPGEILPFANRHGLLQGETALLFGDEIVRGETLSDWVEEIDVLRSWIAVWQALREGDSAALDQLFAQRPDGSWEFKGPGPYRRLRVEGGTDVVRLAEAWGPIEFGERLKGVYLDMVHRSLSEKPGLRLVAHDLHSILWLQLALMWESGGTFKRCLVCDKPFAISIETYRPDKEFCSDGCRMKAYRLRQRDALRYAREGKPVEVIAVLVGSEEEVVERWIRDDRDRRRS